MNTLLRRTVSVVLIACIGLPSLPVLAANTVTCESRHGRYHFCRVDTDGNVELTKELSRDRCSEGRSWGYEDRGIWVDRGCSAEFAVGRDKRHDKRVAIAAGLVGLAAIAAIAAANNNQNDEEQQTEQQPQQESWRDNRSWHVGEFSAFDNIRRAMVALKVLPNGDAVAYVRGETIASQFKGNRLHIGPTVYQVERTPEGFVAYDESNKTISLRFDRKSGKR